MRAVEFLTESKIVHYDGIDLDVSVDGASVIIHAISNGKQLGYVVFERDGNDLNPLDLSVDERFRNQGIAKTMYDYTKSLGFKIKASIDQTEAGKAFWHKHRPGKYVWEDSPLNELGNKPYPFKLDPDSTKDYKSIVTKDGKIEVQLEGKWGSQGWGIDVLFKVDGTTDVTGGGDQFRIFSTVSQILKKRLPTMMNQLDPYAIWFHAHNAEQSRVSLYDKYAVRFFNQLLGSDWKFEKKVGPKDTLYQWNHSPDMNEEVLDEMPLPVDWDPQAMKQGETTFKSRLAYALERAKKLGTGSSRVATVIEYQGRPTVLKIAKNQKGLAQNSVEASILSDGYASQIGIMIPIIDYDERNDDPSWIHTEMATKANEAQLCNIMKCDSLIELVRFANTIAGKYRGQTSQQFIDDMINDGKSEQDVEIMTDYANKLADLAASFDVELADFGRAANWGIYQGNPVVVDVGFNSNVMNQYYKRR